MRKCFLKEKSGILRPSPPLVLSHLESTAAILLRKTRFSDTSLIVTWFTLAHGKIKTVVKGALRPRSRFAGVLDLFFECEITFARSTKSELHSLREAALCDARDGLRRDYACLSLCSYFVELLEIATEHDHPAPEIYGLLSRALRHLDQKPATQRALLHFESEFTQMLGIAQPGVSPIIAFGRAQNRIPAVRAGLLKTLPPFSAVNNPASRERQP